MLPIDPIKAGKAALSAANPWIDAARKQWGRRGASAVSPPDFASAEKPLDEALDTLTGDAASLRDAAVILVKRRLSGIPVELTTVEGREWLRHPEVRRLAKEAVFAMLTGDSIDRHEEEARNAYAASSGDMAWYGGVLFGYVVAFLAITLNSAISPDTRLILEANRRNARQVRDDIAGAELRLDGRLGGIEAQLASAQTPYPAQLVDRHVLDEVDRMRRTRCLGEGSSLSDILAFAERVRTGDLRGAAPDAKTAMFRLAAASLARVKETDDAEQWLDLVAPLGGDDLAVDRARIALNRGEIDTAMAIVGNRQDPDGIGILLDAIARRDGGGAALRYFEEHLSPDRVGGFLIASLTAWYVEAGRLDQAERILASATAQQEDENLALRFLRGRLRVAMLAPREQQRDLFESMLGMPQPSAMRDDAEGHRLMRAADEDLAPLVPVLRNLRLNETADAVDMHRLFLALASPDETAASAARRELGSRLESSDEGLVANAWLASAFDIPIDRGRLRAELGRRELLGTLDGAALGAAFNVEVIGTSSSAEKLAFLEKYRPGLVKVLPPGPVHGVEVEILARSGQTKLARERLADWRELIGAEFAARLEVVIDEQEGGNPVALRLARFEASDADPDLSNLVDALVAAGDERAADFSVMLWHRSRRMEDAARAGTVLFNAGRDAGLGELLSGLTTVERADPRLACLEAWLRYREGKLAVALDLLRPLRRAAPDDSGLRQLEINIAVESGNWHSLAPLVAEDLEHAEHRSARQLLQAAGLAHAIGNPDAPALTRAAVLKAPKDPTILLSAYEQELRRGQDWEPDASGWLREAIELSGEDGPIRSGDLQELLASRAEQQQNVADLDRMIMAGEIPLQMVTKTLGTTLSELILGRLAANTGLDDPRRQLLLPLVAGNRIGLPLGGMCRVGFDPTALLVLHLVGLLDAAIEAFDEVIIPAGTLPLLFNDLVRADRGQPSRVEQALRIRRLIEADTIAQYDVPQDDAFAAQYSRAAELDGYAVHFSPLYEPGSWNQRIVDAQPFADRLIGPQAIADELLRLGEIDEAAHARATGRFGRGGAAWGAEPPLDLTRPLVLEWVSLNALEDAGLLETLARVTSLHVSEDVVRNGAAEIRAREEAGRLRAEIEAVRETLRRAVASGKVRIAAFPRDGNREEEEDYRDEPEMLSLVALLQDASSMDVLVSGDRMLNRHGHITDTHGNSRAIATVIDVIDHLTVTGRITPARRSGARRRLREAGVGMVPVELAELDAAVAATDWRRGPGIDLRAILNGLNLPILRSAVSPVTDQIWLGGATLGIARSILKAWITLPDTVSARAAADTLAANLPPLTELAERNGAPEAREWAVAVLVGVHATLAVPLGIPTDRMAAYHAWYDTRIGPRIRGRDGHLLELVLERAALILIGGPGEDAIILPDGTAVPPDMVTRIITRAVVEPFRSELEQRGDVRVALGYVPDAMDVDGAAVTFRDLADFLRRTMKHEVVPLLAIDGSEVAARGLLREDGVVAIEREAGMLRFDIAGALSDDANLRIAALERQFRDRTLAPSVAARWRAVAQSQPLDDDLLALFIDELRAAPQAFVEHLADAATEDMTFDDLVATDRRVFRNLIDPERPDQPLSEVLTSLADRRASAPDLLFAAIVSAPLAVSPEFDFVRMTAGLGERDAAALCDALLDEGDLFSLVAAFEVACTRAHEPEVAAAGKRVAERVGGEGVLTTAATMFCACAMITLCDIGVAGLLRDLRPEVARCASLAQAGLSARALGAFNVDHEAMLRQVRKAHGPRMLIGGILDRFVGRWSRQWLFPSVIAAYALRRLGSALEDMPEGEHRTEWKGLLDAVAADVDDAEAAALAIMPGPLDEYSEGASEAAEADLAPIIVSLATADAGHASAFLATLATLFEPPADLTALVPAVTGAMERLGQAGFEVADSALILAGAWRSPAIAEAALNWATNQPAPAALGPHGIAHYAVAAAASGADPEARAEMLSRFMRVIAFGELKLAEAAALVSLIDLICNLAPQYASHLDLARNGALLAMNASGRADR